MEDYKERFPNNQMEVFQGYNNKNVVTVGYNQPKADHDEPLSNYQRDSYIYVVVESYDKRTALSLGYDAAVAMRDHLNTLLDETENAAVTVNATEPGVSDKAVEAMDSLAHQLELLYTDDLVNALNRHAEALEGFNK